MGIAIGCEAVRTISFNSMKISDYAASFMEKMPRTPRGTWINRASCRSQQGERYVTGGNL
jgi:hypothetical protein